MNVVNSINFDTVCKFYLCKLSKQKLCIVPIQCGLQIAGETCKKIDCTGTTAGCIDAIG